MRRDLQTDPYPWVFNWQKKTAPDGARSFELEELISEDD
jgi:hypothetical protein